MEAVEKKVQTGLVKFGIGPLEHHEVLIAMGCERVFTIEQIDALMEVQVNPFRDGDADVALFLRPNYVTAAHLKWMATQAIEFQVAGHEPQRLRNWDERQDFRTLTANVEGLTVADGRGAKPTIEISEEHLAEAIRDWHAGDMVKGKWATDYTLKQIEERMRTRTGKDIKAHWVRDQVKKRFGTAARKPPGV